MPVPEFAEGRPDRGPPAGDLEAEEIAVARRDADRAAPVIRMSDRGDPGRDRGCAAARGAAGRAIGVPWAAGDAMDLRFGRDVEAELGRIGTAERDHAGLPPAFGKVGVPGGHIVHEVAGTLPDRQSLPFEAEVLGKERHAGEGAGQRLAGLRPRHLEGADRHRVELGIERLDRGDRDLDQLGCRDLLATDKVGQAEPVVLRVFLWRHEARMDADASAFNAGAPRRRGRGRPWRSPG